MQVVAILLLSAHDHGLLDVVAYFFLAPPVARVGGSAQARVICVEYLLILAFGADPVRRRNSTAKHCLRF